MGDDFIKNLCAGAECSPYAEFLRVREELFFSLPAALEDDATYRALLKNGERAWAEKIHDAYIALFGGTDGRQTFEDLPVLHGTAPEKLGAEAMRGFLAIGEARLEEFRERVSRARKSRFEQTDEYKLRQTIGAAMAELEGYALFADFLEGGPVPAGPSELENLCSALDRALAELPESKKNFLTRNQYNAWVSEMNSLRNLIKDKNREAFLEAVRTAIAYERVFISEMLRRQIGALEKHGLSSEYVKRLSERVDDFDNFNLPDPVEFVQESAEILGAMDDAVLEGTIRREIAFFTDTATLKNLKRTYEDFEIQRRRDAVPISKYHAAAEKLKEFAALVERGETHEARKRYARFASNPEHAELIGFAECAGFHVFVTDLVANTAVVVAAAAAAIATDGLLEPLLTEAAGDIGIAGAKLASGLSFVATARHGHIALTPELNIADFYPEATAGMAVHNLAMDIVLAALMFRFLRGADKYSTNVADEIVGELNFTGLTATGTRTAMKFSGETLAFAGWGALDQTTRDILTREMLEGAPLDPGRIFARAVETARASIRPTAVAETAANLVALKFGGRLAGPLTTPAVRKILQEHFKMRLAGLLEKSGPDAEGLGFGSLPVRFANELGAIGDGQPPGSKSWRLKNTKAPTNSILEGKTVLAMGEGRGGGGVVALQITGEPEIKPDGTKVFRALLTINERTSRNVSVVVDSAGRIRFVTDELTRGASGIISADKLKRILVSWAEEFNTDSDILTRDAFLTYLSMNSTLHKLVLKTLRPHEFVTLSDGSQTVSSISPHRMTIIMQNVLKNLTDSLQTLGESEDILMRQHAVRVALDFIGLARETAGIEMNSLLSAQIGKVRKAPAYSAGPFAFDVQSAGSRSLYSDAERAHFVEQTAIKLRPLFPELAGTRLTVRNFESLIGDILLKEGTDMFMRASYRNGRGSHIPDWTRLYDDPDLKIDETRPDRMAVLRFAIQISTILGFDVVSGAGVNPRIKLAWVWLNAAVDASERAPRRRSPTPTAAATQKFLSVEAMIEPMWRILQDIFNSDTISGFRSNVRLSADAKRPTARQFNIILRLALQTMANEIRSSGELLAAPSPGRNQIIYRATKLAQMLRISANIHPNNKDYLEVVRVSELEIN